jgi:hypothetical protein
LPPWGEIKRGVVFETETMCVTIIVKYYIAIEITEFHRGLIMNSLKLSVYL